MVSYSVYAGVLAITANVVLLDRWKILADYTNFSLSVSNLGDKDLKLLVSWLMT